MNLTFFMICSFWEGNPEKVLNKNSLLKNVRDSITDEIKYSNLDSGYSRLFPKERIFYLTENKTAIELNPAFGRVLEWDLAPFKKQGDFHEAMDFAEHTGKNIPFYSEFLSMIDLGNNVGSRIIGGEKGIFQKLVQGRDCYWCMENYAACIETYVSLARGNQDKDACFGHNNLVLVKELGSPMEFK